MKQNAADLELPATDPANAPARVEFRLGHLPAGSSRRTRRAHADAACAANAGEMNFLSKRPPPAVSSPLKRGLQQSRWRAGDGCPRESSRGIFQDVGTISPSPWREGRIEEELNH